MEKHTQADEMLVMAREMKTANQKYVQQAQQLKR
jgi:hypothetical protein